MKTCLRTLALGLLALGMGCADFGDAETRFCERNPGRCGLLPVALAFSTEPQRVEVGSCSSIVTIQLLDEQRKPKDALTDTSVALSATPADGLQFFTDAGCTGAAVTAVTVPSGSSSASFYLQGTRVGSVTLSATAGTLSGSQELTLAPTAPTTIAVALPASSVTAGTCSSGRVLVRDENGSSTLVTMATDVGLEESPNTSLAFYSDAACTTPSRSVTLTAGASEAPFYFQGQATGRVTVTASAAGLTPTPESLEITPGTGNRLIIVTLPQVVVAGACSSSVLVQSQDAQGNPLPTASTTTITLAATPATGITFYSDSSCGTVVTSATLASGTTNASFYFKGTKAGNVTLTVTAPGYTGSSQAETLNPGPPAALVLRESQTVPAGDCSAPVTVELRDSQGNPTTARADTAINFSASGVAVRFFPNEGCTTSGTSLTIPTGSSAAVFSIRGIQAGTSTLTASSTGLTSATLGMTIASSPASVLTFTTAPQTVPVGSCSGVVTVQVGPQGNPLAVAANLSIGLTATQGTNVTFHTSASCGASVTAVTVPVNQSSVNFYFRSTKVGPTTLTASAPGLSSATQDETLTPGAPNRLLFSTPPRTAVAGTCSPLVSLQSVDVYDNVSPVTANETITLSSQFRSIHDGQFRFYSDASCSTAITGVSIPAGQTIAGFYYRGEKAQIVMFQTYATRLTGATQDNTVAPSSAAVLTFSPSTPPQEMLAGTCAHRVVESRDAYGNLSANALSLALGDPSRAAFFLDANCATPTSQAHIAEGSSFASFYFKGLTGGINAPAPLTLTASAQGLTAATQEEKIIPTVRSGTCTLSSSASIRCPITPALQDLNRAFLTFQATTQGVNSTEGNVRCYLEDSSSILCERASTGGSLVTIRWSVAELPSGVAVQHLQASCQGSTTYVNLSPQVSENRSFVLISSERNDAGQDYDSQRLVHLSTPYEVRIAKAGSCTSSEAHSVQVVEYTGAEVQRGTTSLWNGASTQVTLPSPVAPDRSLVLYSYFSGTNSELCARMPRAELSDDGSTVRFSRGAGDSFNCMNVELSISWEVVQLPPGTLVQQVTQQLTDTSAILTLPRRVDPSRTLVFAGGQWASGQVHGEGPYGANRISDLRARAELKPDGATLELQRETSYAPAIFTLFVVQLMP